MYNLNYQTESDGGDAPAFTYNKTMHNLFLGASLDVKKQFYLGQNILSWTRTAQQGNDSATQTTMSLLELGPRLLYYFNDLRRWYLSLVYNFSVKGTSTINEEEGKIEGTSYIAALGYHYKVTKQIGIGGSLNYHVLTITARKIDSTDLEPSESYTAIIPMLEIAIRFK